MNTLSGRGQLSDLSAFDVNLSNAHIVSDADRAVAVGSVPVSCTVLASAKTAYQISVNGVQSPNVFTGYPVLTLPSLEGLPRHRSSHARTPYSCSPRTSRSPSSPRGRRSLPKKTALEGQPCIDQVFKSTSTASMPHSSLPLTGRSLSLEIRSHSASPDRKRTRLNEVSVSPLLSRNREHFVEMSTPSSDTSAAGSSRSDNVCNGADLQREKWSRDTVTPVGINCVRQSVFGDVMTETVAAKSTRVATAEVQQESFKDASAVSSGGCSGSAASQKHTDKKTAISPLKMPAHMLQKLRQILEKSCPLVCENSVKTSSSSDVSFERSVSLSSSLVSAEMNCVVRANEARSASLYVTSADTSTGASTSVAVVSSQKSTSLSATDNEVSKTTACEPQQAVMNHSEHHDSLKGVSVPAAKMSVSNDVSGEGDPSSTDGKWTDTATRMCPDNFHTNQQSMLDGVETTPVPAAHLDSSNEVKSSNVTDQTNGGDSQIDVDECTLEGSYEFSYVPVESKLFFFNFPTLNRR